MLLPYCFKFSVGLELKGMASKKCASKLSALMPTDDELKKARDTLKALDKASLRSRMASMVHFVKQNSDDEILTSRGDKRKGFLELFLVHQLRDKQAKSLKVSSHELTNLDTVGVDHQWWSKYKMDMEMGPVKAAAWRESKVLVERPDPVTGLSGEDHVEYKVSMDWEKKTASDLHSAKFESSCNGDEQDMATLQESGSIFLHPDAASSSTTTPSPIKVEPKDAEEIAQQAEAARLADIKANTRTYVTKYHTMRYSMVDIQEKCGNSKFHANVRDECEKMLAKIKPLVSIFDNLLVKGSDNEKAMTTLAKRSMTVESDYDEIYNYSKSVGLVKKAGKKS